MPPKLELMLLDGRRLNSPMFRKDLKLFRGVDNTIEFELKDVYQMPVSLTGQDLKCIITNPFNQELMLVRHLYNKDAANGLFELRLSPGDIQKWSAGNYTFCITVTDINGIETLFYTTMDQDVTGTFELIDKPFPAFTPSYLFKSEDFVMNTYNNLSAILNQTINTPNPITIDFITSRVEGGAQKNLSSGLATFSVLLNHFTGKLYVQGTLEENPLTEEAWFNIPFDPIDNSDHAEFQDAHGIHVFNFEGNYNWVRFKYVVTIYNYGNIEKVWLKI